MQIFNSLEELLQFIQPYFIYKIDRMAFQYDYFVYADLIQDDRTQPTDNCKAVISLVIYSIIYTRLQEAYAKKLLVYLSKIRT